jgi:hypothetical protein
MDELAAPPTGLLSCPLADIGDRDSMPNRVTGCRSRARHLRTVQGSCSGPGGLFVWPATPGGFVGMVTSAPAYSGPLGSRGPGRSTAPSWAHLLSTRQRVLPHHAQPRAPRIGGCAGGQQPVHHGAMPRPARNWASMTPRVGFTPCRSARIHRGSGGLDTTAARPVCLLWEVDRTIARLTPLGASTPSCGRSPRWSLLRRRAIPDWASGMARRAARWLRPDSRRGCTLP